MPYQKKDGRGHVRPSFFWYDNDKDLKVCFLVTHLKFGIQLYIWLKLSEEMDGKVSALAVASLYGE